MDDAKVYSGHAGKKTIDTEDVRLAVQCKMDHSFTTPPPRDVCKFVFILETLFRRFIVNDMFRKNIDPFCSKICEAQSLSRALGMKGATMLVRDSMP